MQFTPLSHAGGSIPSPERFPPITYPPQSNVSVNPNRKSCPSDGFNYPIFRLINKSTRVYLSESFPLDSLITYRPFAVANTKGWFAAVRKIGDSQDIIFSPLKDLRESIQKADEGDKGFFFPQRALNLDVGLPTIVAFAQNDTRLLVGSDNGSIHVYDTTMLFSSGEDFVAPLHTYNAQYGALRQIAPNPGTEPDLVDKLAAVRSDGVVQLMNTNLESLGGWSSANPDGDPVAVSWSPKGKHLAIGLRSGDILTFAPNKLSVPNKHLPAAVEGQLVGLNWLGPGHTFRVTYAPQIANQGESIQQIVYLDIKSNVLTAFDTLHPFPMVDRQQESHALILPHWDEDSISENSKSLVVVGDRASSDIEILGGHSGQWFQQSQENPVSLPLDKQSDETTLMVLDLDLADSKTSAPIVYAYLNDGSVQAWRLEHSKPYLKMMSNAAGTVLTTQGPQGPADITVDATMDEKDAANVLTSLSGFATSESNMTQQNSTFGASAQPPSLFGQASQRTFGQTSSFGTSSAGSPVFGRSSAFGPSQPSSSFFGAQPARHAFSDIATHRDTGNVFGGPSFGAISSSIPPPTQSVSDEMTREASMSDGTAPGFGGLSLGGGGSEVSDSKPKTGIFGSFGPAPSTSQPSSSAFDGPIRLAQGFGAFSNYGSTTLTSSPSQEKPSSSAFSSTQQPAPHPAFGQTGFAKPSFGQPSFGQTGFGKPAPVTTAPASGNAFAAFASASLTSFSSALQSNKGESSTTDGFAAYASSGTNVFGAASQPERPSAGAPSGPAMQPLGDASSFGRSSGFASSTSGFGLRSNAEATAAPRSGPTQLPPGMMSPPSSPESLPRRLVGSPVDIKKELPAPAPAPAPASSSSFIRESTAFGGLKAIEETSPFFKKHDEKMPVTAFGDPAQSKAVPSTATPAFGAPSQLGTHNRPVFGSTSQMGAAKSVFGSTTPTTTPTKPAVAGVFSAFSGPSSGFFGLSGGQKKSFSELLKSEGSEEKDADKGKSYFLEGPTIEPSTPSKPISVFSTVSTPTSIRPSPSDVSTTPQTPAPLAVNEREETTTPKTPASLIVTEREESTTPKTPTSLTDAKQEESTTPKTPSRPPITKQEESTTPKTPVPSAINSEDNTTPKASPNEAHRDASISDLSASSIGSFVDVSTDRSYDIVEEGDEGDDARSFLSSDFSSEPSTDEEESEEVDEKKDKLSEVLNRGSLSPTPQPEVPSISVSPSPPVDGDQAPATQGESTTPPGSPSMGPKVQAKSPSPTPVSTTPSSPSPSPLPFSVGLGRPSTRPARSSPLAAKPVSGEEEAEEEGEIKAEPEIKEVPTSRSSVSPQPSIAREEPVKQEGDDVTVRPKTPPLLSAPGGPVSGKESSTTRATLEAEPVQIPSPIPVSAQPPVPVFTKPTEPKKETSKSPSLPEGPQAPKASTAPVPFSPPPFSLAPKPMAPPSQLPPSDSASAMVKPPVFARTEPPLSSNKSEPPAGIKSSGFFGPQPTGVWGLDSHQITPKTPQSALPTPPSKPAAPSPSASQPQQMTIERACFSMVEGIEKELAELKELRDEVSTRYSRLTKAAGGSRAKAELGDRSKWRIADVMTFRQTVLQFENDLVELISIRETFKQTLRELNGNMLRANTRREEIARFSKAKRDKDFTKMLNTRSLGPEHLESQQHFRRSIRAARDRVQKLESRLQESKRKLSQAASGRPYIKAPTLDVINRTYRNIDMAIQQQNDEMARLTDRVSKLKIGSQNSVSGSRDARLPDRQRRGIAITPHVAVTTAAALNAERSAHKLKKALLKVCKEPILNVRAASAPRPPSAFETSRKSPAASKIFESVQGPLFPPPEDNGSSFWDVDLNVPAEDKFHPGAPLPTSKRGAGSNPKKHSSVSLKRTPSEASASPPTKTSAADFWGTPPAFPSSKLVGDVKSTVSFVPLTPPTPAMPSPMNRSKSPSSLPGGGFEAFLK